VSAYPFLLNARVLGALRARLPASAAAWIRAGWEAGERFPGGKRLFASLLGLAIPYTGGLGAQVEALELGYARVSLRERWAVRNHLQSVHAIALANLGELAGNLALAYALPPGARFIVQGLSMEYRRKARGTITAECRCEVPRTSETRTYTLEVALKDEAQVVVAVCMLQTRVGPITSGSK
jgi:acyl-coenzyme A thioesterase PaaI-like protein